MKLGCGLQLAEDDNDWETALKDWRQMVPHPVATGELIRHMIARAERHSKEFEEDCKL